MVLYNNESLQHHIVDRNSLYENWKRDRSLANWAKYVILRSKVTLLHHKAKLSASCQRYNTSLPKLNFGVTFEMMD